MTRDAMGPTPGLSLEAFTDWVLTDFGLKEAFELGPRAQAALYGIRRASAKQGDASIGRTGKGRGEVMSTLTAPTPRLQSPASDDWCSIPDHLTRK